MDVFEIGVALAAPEGLREGLTAMAEMLATLDEAAEAGWARAFDAGRMAAGLGQGAAPRSEPQPARDDVEQGAPSGVEDGGGGMPIAATRSMLSSTKSGQPPARGQREAEVGREQGDRSKGVQKAGGLKGGRGVHLIAGRGSGKPKWPSAAPEAEAPGGSTQRPDGGSRASLRSVAQVAEALSGRAGVGVAPLGGEGGVPEGSDGFGSAFGGGLDRGAVAEQVGPSAAPAALVSRVSDMVPGGARARHGGAQEARRSGAAPSGHVVAEIAASPARRMETEQPDERSRGGLLSANAAAPAQEEGRGDGGASPILELDGRVIGQWLSEQMARDASRPSAGTTFFDPRQAPAWSPSGSL